MSDESKQANSSGTSNAARIQQSGPPRRAKTPRERVMPPVVYTLPGMESAKVTTNLKYTDAGHPCLLMDVYVPEDIPGGPRHPIVLCIHGGVGAEYRPKDWGIFQSWGRLLAAAGMIAVTFTHRLGYPRPFLVEAGSDVRDAVEFIRANAVSFNADPDKICLAAWSGGGPLLCVAMREKLSFVRCLVAFYAYLDCQRSQTHVENETPETVRAFSPITYLQAGTVSTIPLFVARAGQDEVPAMNDSIDRFVAAAIAVNAPITFMNHPLGEHGFDNQNDDERSREIIRGAIAFMQTHLK